MNSKLVFLIPLISLIYFIDTITNKRLKRFLKIVLALLAFILMLINLLIAGIFYVNCWEASHVQKVTECIQWIYPTLDFKLLLVFSMVIFTFSIYGLIKKWHRGIYYLFGSLILYTGFLTMFLVLSNARQVITFAIGVNSSIIIDIFAVVVVYGLVSSLFYTAVFFLGLFTPRIHPRKQV